MSRPTAGAAADDAIPHDHRVREDGEASLSAPPSCGARRRGSSCGLGVLHDGDHVGGDDGGGELRWPRGRREQRQRDAVVDAVERLREEVGQPLEV